MATWKLSIAEKHYPFEAESAEDVAAMFESTGAVIVDTNNRGRMVFLANLGAPAHAVEMNASKPTAARVR